MFSHKKVVFSQTLLTRYNFVDFNKMVVYKIIFFKT